MMTDAILVLVNYLPEPNEISTDASPIYVANANSRKVVWWNPLDVLDPADTICKAMIVSPPPHHELIGIPEEVGYIKTGMGLRILNAEDIQDIVFRSEGKCYVKVDDDNCLVLHNNKIVLLKHQ